MSSLKDLKSILKSEAEKLKNLKQSIRQGMKDGECTGHDQYDLLLKKRSYRHKHIAYCILKGREYEQIEKSCREDNKPDWNLIEEIKREYIEKNVCVSA